jgi:hypothetical protein
MASHRSGFPMATLDELRAMLTTLGYRMYNIIDELGSAPNGHDPNPWAIQWHQNKTYVCRLLYDGKDSHVWFPSEREAIEAFLKAYKNGSITRGPN